MNRPSSFGMAEHLGENWILLRGLARESGHWGEFPALMQKAFPEATVTSLDLPGSGEFYRGRSPHTLAEMTGHLRRQAETRGLLAKPVTLLALSLGGMVACDWLHRFPEEIYGAVFINTSFKGLNPLYQRLRWQIYTKFIGLLFERDSYRRELAILRLVSNRPELWETTAAQWADFQNQRPMSHFNVLNQLFAAATAHLDLAKPVQPLLLLNSKGDRLVDPACSMTIQHQWRCELKSHHCAGHDMTLDDGNWVIGQLQAWLLSHGR
jgi:pimeloyl-ACP methyl ester carboxylesterase